MIRFQGVLGIVVILLIAWGFSSDRKHIPWRVIVWGLGLQIGFALLILGTSGGETAFDYIRLGAHRLLSFTDAGAGFLFGNLYQGVESTPPGDPGWALQLLDRNSHPLGLGTVVAFHVLPIIIFFSALTAILYHLGIMQKIVSGFAFVMQRTMKISGPESLAVAANVFVGMVEAPLCIKPYLKKMSTSELACIMTAGFATVAGSVMASYIRFGVDAGHLLAASVMSAPAAIVIAKIMYPEQVVHSTQTVKIEVDDDSVNVIDAAANGAIQGVKVAAIVAAMLIAFLSLVAMINYFLGFAGTSLGQLLGWIFAPLAFCMGVETGEVMQVGALLGTKLSINEFVAYLDLVALNESLSPRSFTIATFALCGFANLGSVAILIGGIGTLAPERKSELAKMGLKTMLAGALGSFLTATIAGIILG
ncbi:MAG: NupC/NupG family nucleoside CNT transporter [Deltaproteobacteria bacterium]|nr:NupC/NupG family nucleoside CNT transporter [Deltaproteobacteria bacterium]MBN2670437.1 NupC/NupG family nucleoside CNT transporter [Deltaproteobacteria bacterium]